MTAKRIERLARVRAVWEEELRVALAALADARALTDAAQARLDEARARTRAARGARSSLMAGASADEWRAREAWTATCAAREERAFQERAAADQGLGKATRAVTETQQKIERLKLVLERLAAGQASAERRAERREEDELASRARVRGAAP